MKPITEDKIETFAIEVLQSIVWEYMHGLAIAPGAEKAEGEKTLSELFLLTGCAKGLLF